MVTRFSYKENFLEVRPGIRMHYVDEGTGEPVVMVHGNPTWSFYYRHLVKDLKQNFRVIVPDHIGCGRSDRPRENQYDYTLQSRIDDLKTLLSHCLPNTQYRLIVHDWGGMIGLGTALQNTQQLKQVVILNTSGFLLPATRRFHGILRFARTAPGGWLIRFCNAFVRGTLRWGSLNKPMDPQVRKQYLAPYNSFSKSLAVQRFVQDIPLDPHDAAYDAAKTVDDNLHLLSEIPKLLLWGKQDFIFDDAFLNEWLRRFPDIEHTVYTDAGHLVLEDKPCQTSEAIQVFFNRLETQTEGFQAND